MSTDCLIAGGGIGGSVLGHLLARGGKKVIVLERSLEPPAWTRPELLWPSTVQLLFSLRPRAEWKQDAILLLETLEVLDATGTVHKTAPLRLVHLVMRDQSVCVHHIRNSVHLRHDGLIDRVAVDVEDRFEPAHRIRRGRELHEDRSRRPGSQAPRKRCDAK